MPPSSCLNEPVILDTDYVQLQNDALAIFFREYCVVSADRTLSRGFLDGLESLINQVGKSSQIAQAARIVALATIGNKVCMPHLVHNTKQQYGDLLYSFHSNLPHATASNLVEVLMTAVLLGLYEVRLTPRSQLRHKLRGWRSLAVLNQIPASMLPMSRVLVQSCRARILRSIFLQGHSYFNWATPSY